MRETWYVLEGGAVADPRDVAPDAAGVLRHKNGVAVAVGRYGVLSRSMSPEEMAEARQAPLVHDREMKAEPRVKYKTR